MGLENLSTVSLFRNCGTRLAYSGRTKFRLKRENPLELGTELGTQMEPPQKEDFETYVDAGKVSFADNKAFELAWRHGAAMSRVGCTLRARKLRRSLVE